MDADDDLTAVGVEAVAGVNVADGADGLPGHGLVIDLGGGGDLAADQAEVGGDHGLTGHTGAGILLEAGVQDGIGNGICHLVGMAVGNTFGSKQSLLHNNRPFCI